jgi:flagellin-specific chaperone FliS
MAEPETVHFIKEVNSRTFRLEVRTIIHEFRNMLQREDIELANAIIKLYKYDKFRFDSFFRALTVVNEIKEEEKHLRR